MRDKGNRWVETWRLESCVWTCCWFWWQGSSPGGAGTGMPPCPVLTPEAHTGGGGGGGVHARTHGRAHGQAHTDARRHTQDGHDYTAARFSHWSRALYGEVQVRAAHICNNKSIRRSRWSGCAYLWDAVLGVESRPVWHNTKSLSLLNLFLLAPSCRWLWWWWS